jgi:nitroimidazol reductase NimA-like FMN-containing flavoprotein (pyridoxamine 5'-phosphate oxidase superfamily)
MSPVEPAKSRQEMEKILRSQTLGFLGMSLNGTPYVIPLNYGYTEGKILFHCALKGKKLDLLRTNPQVCFTVGSQFGELVPHPQGAHCHADYESVVCFGRAQIIEDLQQRQKTLSEFIRCLQSDAKEIPLEAASGCYAVEIKINKMTGRRQRKVKEKTAWEFDFQKSTKE